MYISILHAPTRFVGISLRLQEKQNQNQTYSAFLDSKMSILIMTVEPDLSFLYIQCITKTGI